jgi:hypothetical protein
VTFRATAGRSRRGCVRERAGAPPETWTVWMREPNCTCGSGSVAPCFVLEQKTASYVVIRMNNELSWLKPLINII